ncbi:MAG: phosphodiesterase [Caulobacteraceae bacterium]|nr:phosphodiesterase [Caulobacteraceae bacterium]
MSIERRIAVIVGSLRKASYSRRLALALAKLAPANLKLDIVEIGDLTLYNEDVQEAGPPEAWTRFRQAVAGADAVIFVTPEYNRSVPGLLKNAIDIGSRPYGKSVWDKKPALVVSNSPGALSGFGANHHLRQSLTFLNMPVVQQPEAYIGHVADLVDDDHNVTKPDTKIFLENLLKAFEALIDTQVG